MAATSDMRWLSVLGLSPWEACALQPLLEGNSTTRDLVRQSLTTDYRMALTGADVECLMASIERKLSKYGIAIRIQREVYQISKTDRENLEDLRRSMIMPYPAERRV